MYSSSGALCWHVCTAQSHHMHLLSPDAQHQAAAARHSRSTPLRIRRTCKEYQGTTMHKLCAFHLLGFRAALVKANPLKTPYH